MSHLLLEPNELIRRLSHRPSRFSESMIIIPPPTELTPESTISSGRQVQASSIGSLGVFPAEILYTILANLDLQSIGRFSLASHRGRALAASLLACQQLKQCVPEGLVALARTGLLRVHSVATLHAALCSRRCATCPSFGPFLFLPAAERCCKLSRTIRFLF